MKFICHQAQAQTMLPNLVQRNYKGFFRKLSSFLIILKNILEFLYNLLFYFMVLCIYVQYSRRAAPKFATEILKKDFENTLKQFFFKNRPRLFTGTHQNIKYLFQLQVK